MPRSCRSLIFWAAALGTIASPASARGEDPPPSPASGVKDEAPIYIFLDPATDLDSVRRKLARPDFVILQGPLYDALKAASRPASPAFRAVIESVVIGGEVIDDLARLTIDLGITLTGDEPAWVPIALDGQIVTSAREGDRDTPIRAAARGGYEVQVRGAGPHKIQASMVSVVLPARGVGEGRRLEWAIPEAASTRVQVVLGANTQDAASIAAGGLREPLALEPIEGGQRVRATAYLTPRKTLEMTWRPKADTGVEGPPLLTAQGEIAIDVERGFLLSRSTWEVSLIRGTTKRLELRIDPAEELMGLELDGRAVSVDAPRDPGSGMIAVPLSDPIAAGGSVRLVVSTRRAISPEGTTRVTYRGVPMTGVAAQSGVLAISQRGTDPWVSASAGRGLRPIDPRAELPSGLRTKPAIVLAYQFAEQPFDLGLQIDPSPPVARAETKTTVAVEPKRVRIDTNFAYTVSRGRIFEVRTALPSNLTLDSVGPDSTVAAYEILNGAASEDRVLVVRLVPKASEEGKFTLRITGREAVEPGESVAVGLPRPLNAQSRGGVIAIVSTPGVAADLAGTPSQGEFSSAPAEPAATWPWPAGLRPEVARPPLWLRHDDAPATLPLAIRLRQRSIREETSVRARIDRKRLEIEQETVVRVEFGGLSSIDLAVPTEVDGLWDVDRVDVLRRERTGPAKDGTVPYRLTFARELADSANLRFRIAQALEVPLSPDKPTRLRIPLIRVMGAETGAPVKLRVAASEGIEVAGDGAGWSAPDSSEPVRGVGPPDRLERSGDGPFVVVATARGLVTLPRLVASSLSLRTSREADGNLRTSATYRLEAHEGSLGVTLPPGSEWVRARVGTESVSEVERESEAHSYRLRLPTDGGPVVVVVEYLQSADAARASWGAPQLNAGAIVQETTWDIRIPAYLALVGVPTGWTDGNEWVWDRYLFSRRPAGDTEPASEGIHRYRFRKVGSVANLSPSIAPIAGIVGVISGAVLGFGLLALLARTWGRAATILATFLILILAVIIPPSVIPLVLQASVLGFVLLGVASSMQRIVDGRRQNGAIGAPSVQQRPSTIRPTVEPGSDDPTVIRNRAGTTVERSPENEPAAAPG